MASDWIGLEHCHEIAVGYMSFSVSVVLSLGFSDWEVCAGMKNWPGIGLEWTEIGMSKWPRIGTGFAEVGIYWKGLGPVPIPCQSMTGEFALIHPPSRLGTIPYRALVPRLSAGMALSNGLKLALDWLGLALH